MNGIVALLKNVLWWVYQRVVGQIDGWIFIIFFCEILNVCLLTSKRSSINDKLQDLFLWQLSNFIIFQIKPDARSEERLVNRFE